VIFSDGSIGTVDRHEPVLVGNGQGVPNRSERRESGMPWEEESH